MHGHPTRHTRCKWSHCSRGKDTSVLLPIPSRDRLERRACAAQRSSTLITPETTHPCHACCLAGCSCCTACRIRAAHHLHATPHPPGPQAYACEPPALPRRLLLPLPSPLSVQAESLLSGLPLAGRRSAAELACLSGELPPPLLLPLPLLGPKLILTPALPLLLAAAPDAPGLFLPPAPGLLLPETGDAASGCWGSGASTDRPAGTSAAAAWQLPSLAHAIGTGMPAARLLLLLPLPKGLGLAGLAASLSAGEVLLLSLLGLCGPAAAATAVAGDAELL